MKTNSKKYIKEVYREHRRRCLFPSWNEYRVNWHMVSFTEWDFEDCPLRASTFENVIFSNSSI